MSEEHTTAVVQLFLDELAGDSPAEPIVRALLDRAVRRLHLLCATLLYRSYPRLTQPPLNLQADELLGAVAERLLKALREARPQTVRQFFALANRHMRWELNDLARRLDNQPAALALCEGLVPSPATSGSGLSPDGRRMLHAIGDLPEDEREAFDLVRVQGMTHAEAAEVLGVSIATVKRRLDRGLGILAEQLADLLLGRYCDQERPQEDVGYFRAAVAIRPSSDEAYAMLGRAFRGTADTDGAIAAFRKALALNPNRAVGNLLGPTTTPGTMNRRHAQYMVRTLWTFSAATCRGRTGDESTDDRREARRGPFGLARRYGGGVQGLRGGHRRGQNDAEVMRFDLE